MAPPFSFWKIGTQYVHLTLAVKIGDDRIVTTPILIANARKCTRFFVFQKTWLHWPRSLTTGKHRAQEIDRETALQTSQNEETNRILFTIT